MTISRVNSNRWARAGGEVGQAGLCWAAYLACRLQVLGRLAGAGGRGEEVLGLGRLGLAAAGGRGEEVLGLGRLARAGGRGEEVLGLGRLAAAGGRGEEVLGLGRLGRAGGLQVIGHKE
jgi:hypothetical protein